MRELSIANAAFEGTYAPQDGITQLLVAPYWRAVWEQGSDSNHGFLVRPEFYRKPIGPVWNPNADVCQGVHSDYATHRAAAVQLVSLPLGSRDIRVEARVSYYAPKGGMAVHVGLDGTGQTESINAPTIKWGPWIDQDGGWEQDTWATAVCDLPVAETGFVSIWLASENRWKGRSNHVFWRQVFGVVGSVVPEPLPVPVPGDWPCMSKLDMVLEFLDTMYQELEAIKNDLKSVSTDQGGSA